MSLQETRTKLVTEMVNGIKLADPTVAVVGDNHPYPQPINKPWIHVGFVPGRRYRTNIGTDPRWRQIGLLNVNVMVPNETGTDSCYALVDTVVDVLADKSYSLPGGGVVRMYSADIQPRGILNGYYTVSVKIEFNKDTA